MPRRSTMHLMKNRIVSSALYCSIVILLNLAINVVCISIIHATNNQCLVYLKDVFSSHGTGYKEIFTGIILLVAVLGFCSFFRNPHKVTMIINTAYFLISIVFIFSFTEANDIFALDALYDINTDLSVLILILCRLINSETMKILYYVVFVGGFYLYFTVINCLSKMITKKFFGNHILDGTK